MKYIKQFENLNDEPKLGEYLVVEINNILKTKFIIKIISNSRDSIGHKYSQVYNTHDLIGEYDSDIYYNYNLKYYFYASGSKCFILFRTFDEQDARKYYNMLDDINKYNL